MAALDKPQEPGTFQELGRGLDTKITEGQKAIGDTVDSAKSAFDRFKNTATSAADSISQSARSTMNTVAQSARNAAGTVSETVKTAYNTSTAKIESLRVSANETLKATDAQIQNLKDAVVAGAISVVQDGKDFVILTKDAAGNTIKQAVNKVENGVNKVAQYVDGKIQYVADVKDGIILTVNGLREKGQAARTKGPADASNKVESAPTPSESYTIKSGDTLSKIAKEKGGNNPSEYLKGLIKANPDMDPNKLTIGKVINLPKKTA